eukprot:51224-Eustigmatos_ZCMA.PRE.1
MRPTLDLRNARWNVMRAWKDGRRMMVMRMGARGYGAVDKRLIFVSGAAPRRQKKLACWPKQKHQGENHRSICSLLVRVRADRLPPREYSIAVCLLAYAIIPSICPWSPFASTTATCD